MFKKRFLQVWDVYRPIRGYIVALSVVVFLVQFMGLVTPFIFKRIIDGVSTNQPFAIVFRWALWALFIEMCREVLAFLRGQIHIRYVAFTAANLTTMFSFSKLFGLSIGQIAKSNSGYKGEVLKKGDVAVNDVIENICFNFLPAFVQLAGAIVALFFIDYRLGLIALVSGVGFVTISIIINVSMKKGVVHSNELDNKAGKYRYEILRHMKTVMLANREEHVLAKLKKQQDASATFGIDLWTTYTRMITMYRSPFSIFGVFGVLAAGLYFVYSKEITSGALVAALTFSRNAFNAVDSIGSMQRRFTQQFIQIGRYFELLETKPAVIERENPIRPDTFAGRIEFNSVSFSYHEDETLRDKKAATKIPFPALHDVSFVIEPGTTCAFVGPSGSGKSTIANLIVRGADPTGGNILIDGNKLVDLALGHWRENVGYVDQNPSVWDGTLAENMLFGHQSPESFEAEDLRRLAEITRIDEFWDRLSEHGFETQVGENGVELSGGQRQRMVLSRVAARQPPVIILDEATSAIDSDNEALVHQRLRNEFTGRTHIIIAHRLSTIRNSDQIFVVDKGQIVGRGSHEELMQTCELYRIMVQREITTLAA